MLRGYAERVKKKLELKQPAPASFSAVPSQHHQQHAAGLTNADAATSSPEPQSTRPPGGLGHARSMVAGQSPMPHHASTSQVHEGPPATGAPPEQHQPLLTSTQPDNVSLRRGTTAALRSGLVSVSQTLRSSKLQKLAEERAAAKAKASALKQTRQRVTLSTLLGRTPQLFDRDKISAVEKFLTHIDELPVRYQSAQVVFLSKNSLTSTSGIGQFADVRVLSLAGNLLSDVDEVLGDLVGLPCLEVLALDANPLASFPFYRARIVAQLPQLKTLDGKDIKQEEREAATALVQQEQAYLAVLLRNACMVHKMACTFQQLQLHRELFVSMYGRRLRFVNGIAPSSVPINPRRMMELWDYEGSLGPQERKAIQAALRREVSRRRGQLQVQSTPGGTKMASWDEAFTQVMLAQQQTIAQLLDMIGSARAELAEEVRLRVTARVINEMHADEDVRRRVLQDDREQLVAGLRTAFQQLSPGSKVLSGGGVVQGTPNRANADERSSRALQSEATRVLFKVTAGSPAANTYSPVRKLEIESKGRPRSSSAGRVQQRPAVARPASAQVGGAGAHVSPTKSPTTHKAGVRGPTPRSGHRPSTSAAPARPQSAGPAARKQLSASSQKLSLRRKVDEQVRLEMQEHSLAAKAAAEHPRWRLPGRSPAKSEKGQGSQSVSQTASPTQHNASHAGVAEASDAYTVVTLSPSAAQPQLQPLLHQRGAYQEHLNGALLPGSAPAGSSQSSQLHDVASELSFGGAPGSLHEAGAESQRGGSPGVNNTRTARQAHTTLSSAALQQLRQRTRQLQMALLPQQRTQAGPAAPWAPGPAAPPPPLPPPLPASFVAPATSSWEGLARTQQASTSVSSPLPVPQAIPAVLLAGSKHLPGAASSWQAQQPFAALNSSEGQDTAPFAQPAPHPPPPPLPRPTDTLLDYLHTSQQVPSPSTSALNSHGTQPPDTTERSFQVPPDVTRSWGGPQIGELRTSTGVGPGGPLSRPSSAEPQPQTAANPLGAQRPSSFSGAAGSGGLWSTSATGAGSRSQHTAQRELFPGAMPTPDAHAGPGMGAPEVRQPSPGRSSAAHVPGPAPISVTITPEGGPWDGQPHEQAHDQDQHIHLHVYPTGHQASAQPAERDETARGSSSPIPDPLPSVLAMGVAYERIERYTPAEHYAGQGLTPAAASPNQGMDTQLRSLRVQLDNLQTQLLQKQTQEGEYDAGADEGVFSDHDDGIPGVPATTAHPAVHAVHVASLPGSGSGALHRPSSAPSSQPVAYSARSGPVVNSILRQRASTDAAGSTGSRGSVLSRMQQPVRSSLDSRLPDMSRPRAGRRDAQVSGGVLDEVLDLRAQLGQQLAAQQVLQEAQDQLSMRVHETVGSGHVPHTTGSFSLPASFSLNRSSLPTGLTGLTVKELESQLVALTLEKEAFEKAMLSEQGEGALLRQELQVQITATDALEAALQDAKQQLQDAHEALSSQTATVAEVRQECSALKSGEEELRVAVDALHAQLLEARMQSERAADAISRRDQERALLAQDLERIRSQYQDTVHHIEFQNKREEAIEYMAWRTLAKRALHALRRAATAAGRERAREGSALSLSTWWRMHRAMRHWHSVVHRTRVLRRIAGRACLGFAAKAFYRWCTFHAAAKAAGAKLQRAALHFLGHTLGAAFAAWRLQSQKHSAAAKYDDPATNSLAQRFMLALLKRKALRAWHQHVMEHARPKVAAANRAARWFSRGVTQRCWRQWRQFVVDSQAKKKFLRRILNRCDARLSMRAWRCWQEYVSMQHKHRQAMSAASLQRTHQLVQAWGAQARRQRALKQAVASMTLRRCLRSEHLALRAWVEHVRSRKRLAVGMQMAEEHYGRSTLYRCFWSWSRATELAAAARAQASGVLAFQRLVQVVLRWRRLSEGAARQAAVVDRAVRMYNHRVVTAMQGAVLREWYLLTAVRRIRRQEACAVFVDAFSVAASHILVHRTFHKWRWLCVDAIKAKCAKGLAQIAESETATAHIQDRLFRSDAEKQRLLDALDKATAQIEQLSGAKGAAEQRALELEADNSELQIQAAELRERVGHVTQERDALWGEAQALCTRVQAADSEAGGMRAELASLRQALEGAQQGTREVQLRLAQQAGQHELQLQSVLEDQATQARELATAHANAKRATIIASDREAELQELRATFEVQLSALRSELQARDEQLEFLRQNAAAAAQPSLALPSQAAGLALARAITDAGAQRQLHMAGVLGPESGLRKSAQSPVMQEVMERWGLSSAQLQAEPSAQHLAHAAEGVPADFSITSFVASFTSAAAKKAAGAEGGTAHALQQRA